MFDHVFYSMFYNDIKGSNNVILYHYKNNGKNRFQNFYELCSSSFDIEYFKNEHKDIEFHALEDCVKYYMLSLKMNLKKYIFFSNAVYKFYNPYALVIYKHIHNIEIMKALEKFICSIHCFNLNTFESMFSDIISKMNNDFSFIVTYIHLDEDVIRKYNHIIFIQVPNKGFDLINKFTVSFFLKQNNIDYEYICFFHSKNCNMRRKAYMNFVLYNYDDIINNIKSENKYGGLLPNLVRIGDPQNNMSSYRNRYNVSWSNNKSHVVDLCNYLQIETNRFIFVEGNSYILHKNICEKIFTDLKLYNSLNDSSTVDLNWVKNTYKLKETNNDKLFDKYYYYDCIGNLLAVNSENKNRIKIIHRDFMFEHAFERIILNLIVASSMKFSIHSLAYGINNKFNATYFDKLKDVIVANDYGNKMLYFNKKFYSKKYFYSNFRTMDDIFYNFINNDFYKGNVYNQYQS